MEGRTADIAGHVQPDWQAVLCHGFEPWADAGLVLDTAVASPEALLEQCLHAAARLRGG